MGKSFEQTFINDGRLSAATNSPIPGISPPHPPNNRFENNFWHRNPTRYGVAGLECPYSYRIPLISMSDNTNNSHQHDPFADQFPTFGGQRKPATPASDVYNRAGRVVPEEITPNKPRKTDNDTTVMAASQQDLSANVFGNPSGDGSKTPQYFPPTPRPTQQQQSTADDYADSSYFATAELTRDDSYAPGGPNSPGGTPDPVDDYEDYDDYEESYPATSENEAIPTPGASPVVAAPAMARDRQIVNEEFLNARSQDEPKEKRGTLDFGLLLVRAIISTYLIIVSVSTFFQIGANPGLTGLQHDFAAYTFGSALSIIIPTLQLAAGVFLLCGLLSPVATALVITVCGFSTLHAIDKQPNFSVLSPNDSVWLSVLLTALAFAMVFTGPGTISFDRSRGWSRRPLASSWIFAAVGLVGAAALWWFGAGANPFN